MSINDGGRRSASRVQWELAGVDDAQSWRPVDAALIPRALSVDDEHLRYDDSSFHREHAWPRDLLTAFAALRDSSPKAILSFAKRAGVLGLPSAHVDSDGVKRRKSVEALRFESLTVWRWLAGEAHAILNAAAHVKAGRSVAMTDWEAIFARPLPAELDSSDTDFIRRESDPRHLLSIDDWGTDELRSIAWDRLTHAVNQWIDWAGIRPIVVFRHYWPPCERKGQGRRATFGPVVELKRPRLELTGGLFGALALQLAAFVTGTRGIDQCSCCGEFFVPDAGHVARRGPGRYCRNCQGTNEAARLASKALRERKARVRALRDQGWTIETIAKELGRPKATIRKWVKE